MNVPGFYLFCLFCFSGYEKNIIDDKDTVQNVNYQFLDINSETEIPVACEDFESQFQGHIISKNIVGPSAIASILKAVNKQSAFYESNSVDIRRKLLLNHASGKTDTLCLPEDCSFFVFKGNAFTINDKKVIKLLSTERQE